MGATHSRFWSIACLGAGLLIAGTAGAEPSIRRTALERLDAAVARGEIAPAEAARQRFFYLFDRDRMSARFRVPGEPPAKCGTEVIAELVRDRALLDAGTRAELDHRLSSINAPGTGTYTTAHFRIEYATSGPDAPTPTDVAPANGIPDFVEWTGAACEQAWAIEVGQLTYTAPAVGNGQNARYPVTYQAQDAYGFTTVVAGQETRIVLHPSYANFPFNEDPEGDVIGALRVTVAHEFKHAIQRMYSPWTEGNWLELDATWMDIEQSFCYGAVFGVRRQGKWTFYKQSYRCIRRKYKADSRWIRITKPSKTDLEIIEKVDYQVLSAGQLWP